MPKNAEPALPDDADPPAAANGSAAEAETGFAHPSEKEFAQILDFYGVRWAYEPRSFPLRWEGDRVLEMMTPDFYLPELDLYIELTTMKQSLVTHKNRKIRRLTELYPDVEIKLLYRSDYHQLLAKYGFGPLANAEVTGVDRILFTENDIQLRVTELASQISHDYKSRQPVLVGILRGVMCFMADLMRQISLPLEVEVMATSRYGGNDEAAVRITKDLDSAISGRDVIMVEDIVDSGLTLNYVLGYLRARGPSTLEVCTLLDKRARRIVDVPIKYVGFEVPDEFVVGYGLDYLAKYRNLPFIGVLKPDAEGQKKKRPK